MQTIGIELIDLSVYERESNEIEMDGWYGSDRLIDSFGGKREILNFLY